ncbi:MAG: lamin tail domain-containing protein [Verrucomicrobiales bacterium]
MRKLMNSFASATQPSPLGFARIWTGAPFRPAAQGLLATLIFALGAGHSSAASGILINEVDATGRGRDVLIDADHENEFVELKGSGGQALDGLALVLYNGTGDVSYTAVDLDKFAADPAGYFVVGTYGTFGADLVLSNNSFVNAPFQVGVDGVALVQGDGASFPSGTPGFPAASAICDALVYHVGQPADAALEAGLLLSGQHAVNENASFDNARLVVESMSRLPDGAGNARETTAYQVGVPTPGAANSLAGPALTISEATQYPLPTRLESSGESVVMTVQRSGPTGAPLAVTLINRDRSEIAVSPASLVIPAGAASANFTVTVVDDSWADGHQLAYFAAVADGYTAASGWICVVDDESDPAGAIKVTEVHGKVFGDANGDGAVDDADEFIEVVNTSDAYFDLSGKQIWNNAGLVHTVGANVILPPGGTYLLFGGGANVVEGITAAFATAYVEKSGGSLDIADRGDVIRVMDGASEIAGLEFWPYQGGSSVCAPEGADPVDYETGHLLVPGGVGYYSPGRPVDQSDPPLVITDSIAITFSSPCLSELDFGHLVATATRTGATGQPVTAALSYQNGDEVAAVVQITIPAGASSATFDLAPVRDNIADGDQTVSLSVLAPGYLNSGPFSFTVVDEGSLDLALHASTVIEGAGQTASALTISLPGGQVAPSGGIEIAVTSSNDSALHPASPTATIAEGQSSVAVGLNAATDGGSGVVILTAIAASPDCRAARTGVVAPVVPDTAVTAPDVTQIADPGAGLFLNEIEAVPAAGMAAFVEIKAAPGESLGGLLLAVFDAAGALVSAHDLDGQSASVSGYFVVSAAAIPGVDAGLVAAGLSLPPAGAAALYRADAAQVAALTPDRLIDAIPYGATGAAVNAALAAQVSGGVLSGKAPAPAVAGAFPSLGRTAVPAAAADLREPALWAAQGVATPGFANGADGLSFSFATPCVSELGASQVTVTRSGDTSSAASVSLIFQDVSGALDESEIVPVATASIPAGQASATVSLLGITELVW